MSVWNNFVGRSNLGTLRAAGVRTLQLHRCVVADSMLKVFLDRAWTEGLTVIPELPARLFHPTSGGCFTDDFDCYEAPANVLPPL